MKEKGWISIHRQLKSHWLWRDAVKLQWWLDILLSVNTHPVKVNLGNDIIECNRGQTIKSLQTWAQEWKTSKDKVRNFFKLLEKDGMVTLENIVISTRLTVCNYDSYQCNSNATQTQDQRNPNASQTQPHPNNKEDNENKVNNEDKSNRVGLLSETPTGEEERGDLGSLLKISTPPVAAPPPKARFQPPDPPTVLGFFEAQGAPRLEAEKFFDYYTANGWKAGKNPMKDWQATARNWIRNASKWTPAPGQGQAASQFEKRNAQYQRLTDESKYDNEGRRLTA